MLDAVPELRLRGQPVVEGSTRGRAAIALAREKELIRTAADLVGVRDRVARRPIVFSFHVRGYFKGRAGPEGAQTTGTAASSG